MIGDNTPDLDPFSGGPQLIVERGPISETQYTLDRPLLKVGRSSNNNLVINDPEISREHARIIFYNNGYAVEDLNSTNGTYVNGNPTEGVTPLAHGDRIEFGDTATVRFVHHDDRSAANWGPGSGEAEAWTNSVDNSAPTAAGTQRWLLGCAGLLLLLCLCGTVTLFALDAYDQGRLLYCGSLRPLWETLLGPFGFNPICP
jgi:hypothetical protein